MKHGGCVSSGTSLVLVASLLTLAGCASAPLVPGETLSADALRITDYPYNAGTGGEELPVQIARFDAPFIHSRREEKRTLELGFRRYPAAEATGRAPIVFLTGSGGIETVPEALIVQLRQSADIVLFDRRGRGFSSPPPNCPARLTYPFDQPLLEPPLTERTCAHARKCLLWLQEQGLTPTAYSHLSVARDLELLVEVLETQSVRLVAGGDGRLAALELMAERPELVERAVLLGPRANKGAAETATAVERLAARLRRGGITVDYQRRPAQNIRIGIGELDLAFLRHRAGKGIGASAREIEEAAAAALQGEYDELAELVLRLRQQLGSIDSIAFLEIEERNICSRQSTTTGATFDAGEYAARWPRSALVGVEQRETAINSSIKLLQRDYGDHLRVLPGGSSSGGALPAADSRRQNVADFLTDSAAAE